ncbi:hypothetical protein [Halostagnicola sp. A56]|uniref:hypothetical protein n=1 Tax=Halostagnicola sp. A56 TaxID=1495067 RepID=UPI0012E0EA9E|nr:hypothetical protein [Halostagnicola sp. A56]
MTIAWRNDDGSGGLTGESIDDSTFLRNSSEHVATRYARSSEPVPCEDAAYESVSGDPKFRQTFPLPQTV